MKRMLFLLTVLTAFAVPAFAEVRFDIGFDVPRGLGGLANGGVLISQEVGDALNQYIFPFPEAGLYYQGEVGPIRLGAGARVFTFILESVFWPNAFVEFDAGPIVVSFQVGGGLFGLFGVFNNMQSGAVLIPDLSVWFKLGSSFRLGGGALGFMLPEVSKDLIFVYYFGAKFVIPFK